MNRSRRKPISCSAIPGSSPSVFAYCATLLPFPLSFPSLPFSFFLIFLLFSSSFPFFFSSNFFFFSYSGFLSSLLTHTFPSTLAFLFPFPPFSLFDPSSLPDSSHASTSPMHHAPRLGLTHGKDLPCVLRLQPYLSPNNGISRKT